MHKGIVSIPCQLTAKAPWNFTQCVRGLGGRMIFGCVA